MFVLCLKAHQHKAADKYHHRNVQGYNGVLFGDYGMTE